MTLQFPIKFRCLAIFFILLGSAFFVQAQTIWNKTYIDNRDVMLFSATDAQDSFYFVSGMTTKVGTNLRRGLLGKISSDGLLTYETFIDSLDENFNLFTNALVRTNDNRLAFCGYSFSPDPHLLFGRKNLTNNTLEIHLYPAVGLIVYHGNCIVQVGSDFFIAGLATTNGSNSGIFLTKIDSAGSLLWEKYYNPVGYMEEARSICQLKNGNLLIGAFKSDANALNEHSNTWLLEVDTAGNLVQDWLGTDDSTYAAERVIETIDGGFIYVGTKKKKQLVGDVYFTALVERLDSNFNSIWKYYEGGGSPYTGLTDIEYFHDNAIVICGSKLIEYGDSSSIYGWVSKLDLLGNVIWSRTYKGINADETLNFLNDIDILDDGSLIAVGQVMQPGFSPPQVGWFLRLDSNGCEIENCTVGMEPVLGQENSIKMFPNPTSEEIYVEVPFSLLGGGVTLYNLVGQQVLNLPIKNTTFKIPVYTLPRGLYILNAKNGLVTASTKVVLE